MWDLFQIGPVFSDFPPVSNQFHTVFLRFLECVLGNFSQYPISPHFPLIPSIPPPHFPHFLGFPPTPPPISPHCAALFPSSPCTRAPAAIRLLRLRPAPMPVVCSATLLAIPCPFREGVGCWSASPCCGRGAYLLCASCSLTRGGGGLPKGGFSAGNIPCVNSVRNFRAFCH